jgi:hypothetical protein
MSFGEYLSVPFLISLGITLLLVGIVGMFFTQRLQEQNHKINSMVGLVSTMAEEMSYLRNRLTQISSPPNAVNEQISFEQNKLIEVSDGEDDSDNDSESEQDETSCETGSDSGESDEDNEVTLLNDETEQSNIKVINIHDNSNDKPFEPILSELEELNNDDVDDVDDDDDNDDDYDDESESSESANLVELDSNNDLNSLDISSDNKNINVDLSVLDYKKLSLSKLRNIVIEKGLTKDASKLKKHDLLELLGF